MVGGAWGKVWRVSGVVRDGCTGCGECGIWRVQHVGVAHDDECERFSVCRTWCWWVGGGAWSVEDVACIVQGRSKALMMWC